MGARIVRDFGKIADAIHVPNLIEVQLNSYERFLQAEVPTQKRKSIGLEALFKEIFPIESYDKTMSLEYLGYEFDRARYSPNECRELRLTYGYPLKIACRLKRSDAGDISEQVVYIGEIPIMIGGGEFIINGAERVIVNQLHRSPGVDFLIESKEGDRVLHGGRIIPERGSWIEISVTRKDVLIVRIDQSSKIPATMFLRAMGEQYSATEAIIRLFFETKTISVDKLDPLMWAVEPVVDAESGEIIVEAGTQIGDRVHHIQQSGIKKPTRGSEDSKVNFLVELSNYCKKCQEKESEGERIKFMNSKFEGEEAFKWLRKIYLEGVLGFKEFKEWFPGMEFKYVRTNKDKDGDYLTDEELEALEKRLIYSHPSEICKTKEDRKPRLNKEVWTADKWEKIFQNNQRLQDYFEQCEKEIKKSSDWIRCDSVGDCYEYVNSNEDLGKKGDKEGPQGVYFFRPVNGEVNEGYIGLAGKKKAGDPDAQGLRKRLGYHFGGNYGEERTGTDRSLLNRYIDDCLKRKRKDWDAIEDIIKKVRARKSKKSATEIEVIEKVVDPLILNTLAEDDCESHQEALLKLYARLRPGNPPNIEKAKTLFQEKFFDGNRYRLGRVGRFRLNRKFKQEINENEMTLRPEDFLNTMRYIVGLRNNQGVIDDIDHLGNRRLRTIDELASDEIRKGLLKLRRTVQERMSMKDPQQVIRIADLVNSKSVSSSVEYFFGRGELSQVVDQTNALSQLTHERRLSALGPGGLNRKRAGFEVRDVHISHYGRICPIETPEGTNIGLIASLAIFSRIDEYGFLLTPYRKAEKGKITGEVAYLRADEEMEATFAPPGAMKRGTDKLQEGIVLARKQGELSQVDSKEVDYVDISSKQIVGISAALIPFLEHDDANRALMGSNMMRQAVPLLTTEPPLVLTGMEEHVARNSSMVVRAGNAGTVTAVDAKKIVIDDTDIYELEKFVGLNERTCLNQVPMVSVGQKVKKNDIIADGGGSGEGVLALGKNVLVAFIPFDGFNFEDAILISEGLVRDDVFTSIHIDEFSVEVRETKLGREEFTRDIPNVGEKALRNLDESGIVREGTRVDAGDILVGKVSPKSKTELTPEEKLLHAIFGRAGEDVKNDSLELPSGYNGVVIKTSRFTRKGAGSDEQKKAYRQKVKEYEIEMKQRQCTVFKQMINEISEKFDIAIIDPSTRQRVGISDEAEVISEQIENFDITWVKPANIRQQVQTVIDKYMPKITEIAEEAKTKLERMKHGDELPSGVLEMVKAYVATKRTLSIGDKMAGRHGNKGVIARIMPVEDMPYLEDGTPVDICLNPLGVPSRMNVGQILETHLGWAAKVLGFDALTPVFAGATEEEIKQLLVESNEHVLKRSKELAQSNTVPSADEIFAQIGADMKATLYDGRTGEPFEQAVTVGHIYMMKLHHLVDDKIHARSTGPYSLITQQPLGGKARTGGQRFGEMEVWALEAYGAAYTLQELLTVKSDDIEGRTKIYESMVKGKNTLEAGTPISFDVLCSEIRGLGLNIQLEKKRIGSAGTKGL
jgi:DNA-directed RNA polymerase subunit beta